jgi:hypothetical protein
MTDTTYIAYVCLPPDGELPLVIVYERKHPVALSVEVYREPERRNMSVLRYCDEIVRGVARSRNRAKSS